MDKISNTPVREVVWTQLRLLWLLRALAFLCAPYHSWFSYSRQASCLIRNPILISALYLNSYAWPVSPIIITVQRFERLYLDRTYAKEKIWLIERQRVKVRVMSKKMTRLEYCQYLLVTQINYTLTNFADHSSKFSHDKINRTVLKIEARTT